MEEIKKTQEKNSQPQEQSLLDSFLEWVEAFVFAIFIVLLLFIFVFRTIMVDGTSMQHTLEDKDKLVLTHFNYEPQRGDIIVANSVGLNKTIIKRCIGVSGDKVVVNYEDNTVTVNGKEIDQSYLTDPEGLGDIMMDFGTFDPNFKVSENVYEYEVPKDCIFAMGDNRNGSRDCRDASVGFINKDDVLGKAVFRFYPVSKIGKLK